MAAVDTAEQSAMAVLLAAEVRKLIRSIDVHALDATLPAFTRALHALLLHFGRVAAGNAVRRYAAVRREHGLPPVRPRVAGVPPLEQVQASVDWATSDLWGNPEPNLKALEVKLVGAAEKMALDVGRQTTLLTVQHDRDAFGWARVPESDCCAFCALLATRGAVYKTRDTADFLSHDHCRCDVEPVFNAYEPSARVREWQAFYREVSRGVHGSANVRRAWRHAFDERYPQPSERPAAPAAV